MAHRAAYALGPVKKGGKRVEVLFGVLREVSFLMQRYEPRSIVWCFDSRFSIRKKVYPPYKSNRNQSSEKGALHKQINLLRKRYLPMLGFRNIFVKSGYEADDLIAVLCREKHFMETAVIVSADSDLRQCLHDTVRIWNPQRKEEETADQFFAKYGRLPMYWGTVKSITGCSSDCVEGIPGIGEKTAWAWIRGELDQKSSRYKKITDNIEVLIRNSQLVVLPYAGLEGYRMKVRKDHLTEGQWRSTLKALDLSIQYPG